MKIRQQFYAAPTVLALLVTLWPSIAFTARPDSVNNTQDQQPTGAAATLERGYRTGYSDGYQAGYRDVADGAEREFRNKEDYRNADRAYLPAHGAREDFRDGYQQGYETGYAAGYDRRSFDSSVPADLARRAQGDLPDDNQSATSSSRRDEEGPITVTPTVVRGSNGSVAVPANTVMLVELLTSVSSDASQRGDRIQARVLEPAEYEGAMLDGRLANVKRAGRVRSGSELQLTFEQLRLADGRWTDMEAQVIEVVDGGGDSGVGGVDQEGGVKGKDSTKGDVAKVGAGSAIGAIIGAIAGGGRGAAIGAVIGGASSTGGVLASRGQDIRLPRGTQLRVRTARAVRVP